jgi:hypothetical protein
MIHATPQAEAASPVRAPRLARRCECGAAAGVSGRCAACEAEARLGARPPLALDASERGGRAPRRLAPSTWWASAGGASDGPGTGVLQRAPATPTPAAPVDVRPPEQLHVYMKATVETTSLWSTEPDVSGGTVGPFYGGDTILVEVWKDSPPTGGTPGVNSIPEPIAATFSSGDVAVAETWPSKFLLRVGGGVGPGAVEMTLASAAFAQPLKVWMVLDSAPAAPDVHDPEAEKREAALEALRGERKEHRAARRAERRALRAERPAAGPAERKAMRAERQAARKASREESRRIRDDVGAARAALVEYDETAEFSRNRQGLIQAAAERGIAKAADALGRLSPGKTPDEQVALALEAYFKLTSTPATAAQVRATLQRIVDVLGLARNSMLTADYSQFELGENCDEETGAYVSERGRGKTVTICKDWVEGEPDFGVTTGKSDGQAYALLHEFVHLSGITAGGKERYNHQGEWAAVTADQALTMADAYTAFAWKLGGGR